MAHASHFLERLHRVEHHHVDLAMSLYRDPTFVGYVLDTLRLPEHVDRLALALCNDGDGPYVVMTREGDFVTCLGEGMQPHGLHVVSRRKLDALVGWREQRAASVQRLAELEEEGESWRAGSIWKRIKRRSMWLTREDFRVLEAMQPIIVMDEVLDLIDLDPEIQRARDSLKISLGRGCTRANRAQTARLKAYWEAIALQMHLSVLVAMSADQLHALMGENFAVVFADLGFRSFREGIAGGVVRGLWCCAEMGPTIFDHQIDMIERQESYWQQLYALFGLAMMGMRHESLYERTRIQFERWIKEFEYAGVDDLWLGDRTTYTMSRMLHDLLTTPENPFEPGLLATAREIFETDEGDDDDEVTVEDLMTLWASDITDFRFLDDGISMLISALPILARLEPHQLYPPDDWLPSPPDWQVEWGLELFRNHHKVAGTPEPVRVEPTPGRNDPCSCGSGRKYKRCCLLAAQQS